MTEAPLTKLGALGMLSAEALATLRAAGEVDDVAVDTTLCRSGDPCAEVWVVLGGALSVQWLDEETNESYPIAYLGQGELYGTHCVGEQATHAYTVLSAANSRLLRIPAAAWRALSDGAEAAAVTVLCAPALRRVAARLLGAGASSSSTRDVLARFQLVRGVSALDEALTGSEDVLGCAIVAAGAVRMGERTFEAGEVVAQTTVALGLASTAPLVAESPVDLWILSGARWSEALADQPDLARAFLAWTARREGFRVHGRPAVETDRDHVPEAMDEEDEDGFSFSDKPSRVGLLQRKPFFFQRDQMDCGAACMRMVTRYYGFEVSYTGLKTLARVSRYGTSLWDLSVAADAMGYVANAVQLDWAGLKRVDLPAIAHLHTDHHFVVVWRVSGDRITLGDPKFGNVSLSREAFEAKWRGVLLILKPTDRLATTTREMLEAHPGEAREPLLRLLSYIRPFRTVLLHVLLASVILQGIGLVPPLATQVILDRVLVGWDQHLLTLIGAVLVAAAVLSAAVEFSRAYLIFQMSAKLERILIESLYRRLLRNHAFFNRYTTSDLLSRFGEVYRIKDFFVDNLVGILIDMVILLGYGLILLAYSPRLLAVVLAVLAVHLVVLALVGRSIRGHTFMFLDSYDRYRAHLLDSLKGHHVIRAHALEWPFARKLDELHAPAVEYGFKASLAAFSGSSLFRMVDLIGAALILWLGAQLVLEGGLTVGGLVAFTLIAAQFSAPVARLAAQYRVFHQISVNLHRVSDLLVDSEVDDGSETAVMSLPDVRGHLVFEDVSFHYPRDAKEKSKWALEHCSFEIQPGEVVAVCGRSGCGKSTLVSLLLRLFDPQEGQVWIDGFNLRDVTPESVREQFGMVTQEVTLFAGTIFDNIACGRGVSEEAVVAAGRLAGVEEFVSDLPYGYHTLIGERGLKLSGGQHQRIVIARALVTDPKILIFDEATASLDPLSESLVHGRLQRVIAGRTTIVISHRLSSLENADRILVMDKGRIVEAGQHDSLMARDGLYTSLVAARPAWREASP